MTKKNSRSISKNPKGLDFLDDWVQRNDFEWTREEKSWVKKNKSFFFKFGREILVVKDAKVGNLKQWALALGLNYSTVCRRRQYNHPIEEILSTVHRGTKEHYELPKEKRLVCPCDACKSWVLANGFKQEAKIAKKKPSALQEDFPLGVAEPELWLRTLSAEYCFKYKGVYKTVEDWAKHLGVSKLTLYARLVKYSMPIKKAMKPSVKEPIHGTRSCYQYHKCRCLLCRQANAEYSKILSFKPKIKH